MSQIENIGDAGDADSGTGAGTDAGAADQPGHAGQSGQPGHAGAGEAAQVPQFQGFSTLAIHAGQEPDALTGAVVPPIYQVSTYKQDGVGGLRGGYEYSRSANPTRTALEECLAALEGGARGLAFASGLAAEDCLLRAVCVPGSHVIIPIDAYGGTFRLFAKVYEQWGVQWTATDLSDIDAVRAAVLPGTTKAIWVETPSNPLLGITDLAALAGAAADAGALLVVDNTFATPYLQQPLALGADVVVHSTTKYMGGHSDVIGGALVAADPLLGQRLAFHQNAMGAVAGPFDAWLTLRGIRTLGVRMDRHCANAAAVAAMLVRHPKVAEVRYPGLPGHPGHEIAAKQMRGFGGMVSFRHADGEAAAVEVCNRARLFTLGESLGGVESLIEHPGRMTHASAAGSPLEVPDDLVRLSVGIEDADDLLADLEQALG
ncbi:MAG TPA: cystathionine gamma-synthase [Actinocrinis sp.]|jgi:cystathionine gamma-synthase